MARWVFGCPDCSVDFTYAEIPVNNNPQMLDPFVPWSGPKPKFPESGMAIACPNCNNTYTYQRYQLIFRA
jgi:hypothetical protein